MNQRIVVEGDEDHAYDNVENWYIAGPFLMIEHQDGSKTGLSGITEFRAEVMPQPKGIGIGH